MKKAFVSVAIIFMFIFLMGCNDSNPQSSVSTVPQSGVSSVPQSSVSSAAQTLNIQEYFPIRENVRYVYEGKGNEYAAYDVNIDYTAADKVQQRINNGGTEVARVISCKEGKLIRQLSRAEVYYRENLLTVTDNEEQVLLMEPLIKGTTWVLPDTSKRTITDMAAPVTVPSGSYQAIEVTTDGPGGKTMDYYAKGVGLVKSVFVAGGEEISSSLAKIEENATFVQKVSFFYPDTSSGKVKSVEKDVSFKTNSISRQVLETAYKQAVDPLGKVFSTDTKINSLYLNKDKMVYIDLNKAFLTQMNAGAEYESMILQSIANTFGKYYGADKAILTIENQLYESGHIAMKKGEYIKAQY